MTDALFTLGIPPAEKIVRTVAVYGALAVFLRLAGKRDLGQFNSFDLVVVLLLSNVVQNAVIGEDNSLLGGLLGAAVLLAANAVVVRVVARSAALSRVFEGTETVLVRDGRFDERALRREGLRQGDLVATMRQQGADRVDQVERATLAPGGSLIVRLRDAERDASRGDVRGLERRLDQIDARLAELLDRRS